MKITDALLGEHGVFYATFDHLERVLPDSKNLSAIKSAGAALAAALASHAHIEDELLFGALEPVLGTTGGPLMVMRMEHDQIEGGLDRLPSVCDTADACDLLLNVVQTARGHFAKEEQILYPIAGQVLEPGALDRLGIEWAARRKVVLAAAPACHAS